MKVISDSGVSISSLPIIESHPMKSDNSESEIPNKDTAVVALSKGDEGNKSDETDDADKFLLNFVRIRVEQNGVLSAQLINCLDTVWHRHFPTELLYKAYLGNKMKHASMTLKVEEDRKEATTELSSKEGFIKIFKENSHQPNYWQLFKLKSNYALLSHIVINSSVSSNCYASVRPPLWLIYSLIRHPLLSLRESALSGYCVWLHFEANKWIERCERLSVNFSQSAYFDLSIPTTQSHTILPPHFSRVRAFATGLLSPTSPLWCVPDPHLETDLKVYQNRHLCSVKLLNRAFGLILHGLGKYASIEDFEIVTDDQLGTFVGQFMENNCSLESVHRGETGFISEPVYSHYRHHASSSEYEKTLVNNDNNNNNGGDSVWSKLTVNNKNNDDSRNNKNGCKMSYFHRYYLLSTFPVLYSTLIGCFVDAILSRIVKVEIENNTEQHNLNDAVGTEDDNKYSGDNTTPEIELCSDGLDALIILLQDSDKCVLSTAVKSGLLPVIFNLAWLLEFGMNKVNSLKSHANYMSIDPALIPYLV
ncbi:unnamed protein product [Heterobilharzia americana]|nr:unnamed protein product [Heterobilharzia americana]